MPPVRPGTCRRAAWVRVLAGSQWHEEHCALLTGYPTAVELALTEMLLTQDDPPGSDSSSVD